MAIYRHTHADCFTVLPNALIRDNALTLRDVGLLVYLLSLPEDWQFSLRGMMAVLEKDGRVSIQTSLHSLENRGYLRRFQVRGEKGKLKDMVWDITDIPGVFSVSPAAENPHSDAPYGGSPCAGKLHAAELHAGNLPQTKKQFNKEKNNKEIIKQTQGRKEYLAQEYGETDLPYVWKSGYEM